MAAVMMWGLGLGIPALVIYMAWRVFSGPFRHRGKIAAEGPMICADCGSRGYPRTETRGSIWIEVLLWLCLLLPGLIYSLWRLSTRKTVCPACRHTTMIPASSPRGAQLAEQFARVR